MSLPLHTVGTRLPELAIALDRTAIVAGALASQDFEDVHHDPGKAQERGTPDIFMSINTTNGHIDRYITDWTGPTGRITSVKLRLGIPNFPGDTMQLAGEVVERTERETTIAVTGSNARGVHVTARVTVSEVGA
ncbi:acyl dehydratase [Streptomyces soliscabiei]|uniref:acyl dehydratase n=1 Tax=Streptomyces soliscabiei TaxID=588897 RepID=UPI0029B19C38|nr:acyl dehydratase [Streptomyces sp. NY05-11A]MDX2676700.1 MaoC/PaaZ C-terminal domain-containing protein [Streptomyces sp. NY05-11A]